MTALPQGTHTDACISHARERVAANVGSWDSAETERFLDSYGGADRCLTAAVAITALDWLDYSDLIDCTCAPAMTDTLITLAELASAVHDTGLAYGNASRALAAANNIGGGASARDIAELRAVFDSAGAEHAAAKRRLCDHAILNG